MMKKNKESKDIIKRAEKRLEEHRKSHHRKVGERLDSLVYWTSLILLALFNLIATFFLIPFLMFFSGFYLYITVGSFGFVFGFLFNLLILGIKHLDHKHHVIAGIFIPILAILDILLILQITEKINNVLINPIEYNVPAVIIVFILAFVLPYLIALLFGKHKI